LSAYLCLADSLHILQCWYYLSLRKSKTYEAEIDPLDSEHTIPHTTETEQLISASESGQDDAEIPVVNLRTVTKANARTWAFDACCIFGIYAVGGLVWLVSHGADFGSGTPNATVITEDSATSMLGVALGYLGAACYLW
jgi:hypothetical protein